MFQKFGRGLTQPWSFLDLNDTPNSYSLPEGLFQIAKTGDQVVVAPVVPVYRMGTAGENISKGNVVYIGSDGNYYQPTEYSKDYDIVGVAYNDAAEGDSLLIIVFGIINGFENLKTGKKYFLDKNLHLTTDTLKGKIQYGIAVSETEILIELFSGTSTFGGGGMIDMFEKREEYDSNGNLIFEGSAPPGSKESDPVWFIQRYIYESNSRKVTRLFANRDTEFNKVWRYREYYNYFDVFSELYEYDENGFLKYKGKGIPGATPDSLGWVIARNTADANGNTIELGYAEGNRITHKNIWNNRESYNYEVGHVVLIEYDTHGYIVYKGTSEAGKQTDKPIWTIEKHVYYGNKLYSIGVEENVAWDNREAYDYSSKYIYLSSADGTYIGVAESPAYPTDPVWEITKVVTDPDTGNVIKIQKRTSVRWSEKETLDYTQEYCELYDYDDDGKLIYVGKTNTPGHEEWKNIWVIEKNVIDEATGQLLHVSVANKNLESDNVWSLRESYNYDEGIIRIYDYDTDGKVIYEGHTVAGAKTSDPAFLIYKFNYDVDRNIVSKLLPNTDPQEYNKVWDDRATYF